MPISFVGDYPEMSRIRTGMTSLDVAVAGNVKTKGGDALGLPLRCGYHIYSRHTGIGKTQFSLSLLGMVSGATKKGLSILPTDTFSIDMAQNILQYMGADGEIEFIHEVIHADGARRLEKAIAKPKVIGTLLDSVTSYMSVSRTNSDSNADSSMGQDARELSNHCSHMKSEVDTAKEEKMWIMTNHLFPKVGGGFGAMGYVTKGGARPNTMTSIHIKLDYVYAPQVVAFPNGHLLQGEVEKNNFGITGQIFRAFLLGGFGLHRGLTAAYDCVMYGLAKGGNTETKAFEIDGKKHISPRKGMEVDSNDPAFDPFYELLVENEDAIMKTVMTKAKARAKIESDKKEKVVGKEVDVETGEVTDIVEEIDTMGMSPEEMMGG